jgi:hypothetical protein
VKWSEVKWSSWLVSERVERVQLSVESQPVKRRLGRCCEMAWIHLLELSVGRAIAQEVSRWLPTAATRFRTRVRSCGICCGQSGTGARFLPVIRFSLPIFIPPAAPQTSSSIIWGWYNRLNSGRGTKWAHSHLMRKKLVDSWQKLCTGGCDKRTWVREAEESPLLQAVARERMCR